MIQLTVLITLNLLNKTVIVVLMSAFFISLSTLCLNVSFNAEPCPADLTTWSEHKMLKISLIYVKA